MFVNSLPESSFVSRGVTTFDIFRRGVSPVETDPGEPGVSGRRIEQSTSQFQGVNQEIRPEQLQRARPL